MRTFLVWLLTAGAAGMTLLPPSALGDDKTKKKERLDSQARPVARETPRPAPIRDVPAPGAIPGVGDSVPASAADFMQVHNDARRKVGAPALRWSDTLAKYAQAWADQLASSGSFQH